MDIDQILSGDEQATDISTQLPDLTSSLTDMLAPFIWLSVALSIIFIVLYASSMLRRRKLERALFDIQKNLRELNERDRARSHPPVPPAQPLPAREKDSIIARSDGSDRQL